MAVFETRKGESRKAVPFFSVNRMAKGRAMGKRVLSAGIVVVRPSERGHRYLLLRAYNYWDFPKGEVEEGEDPLDTAKREVMEEAGLVDLSFPWGKDFRETPPYGRGKVARYYIARSMTSDVTLAVNPELGCPEHHEYRWLDYEAARELLQDRVKPILDWAESVVAAKVKKIEGRGIKTCGS